MAGWTSKVGCSSSSRLRIHSEKDVLKLVTALMTNTKGEGQGGDPFWDKAERLLLVSLIAYLHYEAPVEEQNFATLLEMLNTMQVSEDDETYQNPVDLLFEDLGKKKPKSFAVRQYKLYKLAAGKTAKSILISCGARLAPFDIQEVRDAHWAKRYNLKEMSKTLIFLQENKIGSIEEMQERVDAATARYHELGDSIKAAEARMAEIAVLRTHIVNYARTRPVYDAYRKAGTILCS